MKTNSSTSKVVRYGPRIAVFLAGVAAGAWKLTRKPGGAIDNEALNELRQAAAKLENRVIAQESATAERLTQIETRLDEHSAKLAEVPSTTQIVAAMELLLSKTMATLDERLTTQANSIEILKGTVSQTDSVLERILESLDSLQSFTENPPADDESLLQLTM